MSLGLNTGTPNGLGGKLLSQTRYRGGLRLNKLPGPWGDFTADRARLQPILKDAHQFSGRPTIITALDANLVDGEDKPALLARRLSLYKDVAAGKVEAWTWWLAEFRRVLSNLDGLQDVVVLSMYNGPETYGAYWNVGGFEAKRRFLEFTALLLSEARRRGWQVAEEQFEQVHVYVHNEQWSQAVEQNPIPKINATDYGHPMRIVTEFSVHGSFGARRAAVLDWMLVSVLPNIVGAGGIAYAHDPLWTGAIREYTGMEIWGRAVLDKHYPFPSGAIG